MFALFVVEHLHTTRLTSRADMLRYAVTHGGANELHIICRYCTPLRVNVCSKLSDVHPSAERCQKLVAVGLGHRRAAVGSPELRAPHVKVRASDPQITVFPNLKVPLEGSKPQASGSTVKINMLENSLSSLRRGRANLPVSLQV